MKILINGEKKYDILSSAIRSNTSTDTSTLILSAKMVDGVTYDQFKEDLSAVETLSILRDAGEVDVSEYNYLTKFDREIREDKDTINITMIKSSDRSNANLK